MKPSLLLLAPNIKDRRRLARALGATGCRVETVSEVEAARARVHQDPPRLLVVDYGMVEPERWARSRDVYHGFLEEVKARLGDAVRVLLLSDRRAPEDLLALFETSFLTNLVAKNHPLDLDELITTVGKLVRGDLFGIDKYLCYGVRPERHEVRSSRDKDHLIDAMQRYARDLGIHRRLIGVAKTVADEFLMNAIYNAPTGPSGAHLFAHLPRTEPVDLNDAQRSWFEYACDGRHLVLSIRDPFGSLQPATVMSYLRRCFTGGADQIEAKEGGAGMGLYFIVESLNKVIINIDPGRAAEMIGLIDISGSYRDYAEQGKSFHIFVSPASA